MAPGAKRSGGIFFLLAIIIILVLVAVVVASRFLPTALLGFGQKPQAAASTPVPTPMTIKVVVLAQPVIRGGVITEAMLQLVDIPQTQYTQGLFFTDIKDVVNKRAKLELQQGLPLTNAMVMDNRKGSTLSFDIPSGMVAISVPISRLTSVAYALQPGDHVNVLVSFLMIDVDPSFQSKLPNKLASATLPGPQGETGITSAVMTISQGQADQGRTEMDTVLNQPMYLSPSEPARPRLVSQTLIQDAIVLWMGDFTAGAYEKATGGGSTEPTPTPTVAPGQQQAAPPPPPPNPDLVTLVVSPQDAVTINQILLTGPGAQLNLALRSAGDLSKVQTEAVTLQFIIDQYVIPIPAKLPYNTEPRIPETGLSYPILRNGP
jgi:Flp pilus assembly protein CpaB